MLYFMTIVFFFNQRRIFLFWIFMELNLLTFILIIIRFKLKDAENREFLYYFLIQSIGSIFFLYRILFQLDSTLNVNNLLTLALVTKISIFPIHFWSLKIGCYLDKIPLIFFLTSQKIPMLYLIRLTQINNLFFFLLLNIIFMVILSWKFDNLKLFLISTSTRNNIWTYIIVLTGYNYVLVYYLVYTIFLILILNTKGKREWILTLIFFIGLPPLPLFALKFKALFSSLVAISLLEVIFLWRLTFILTICYMKLLYQTLLIENFPTNIVQKIWKHIFLIIILRILVFY